MHQVLVVIFQIPGCRHAAKPKVPAALAITGAREILNGQTGIANDTAHSKRINRIVAWNGKNSAAVRHHDVLPLPNDLEARLFKSTNCVHVDAGNLRQGYTDTSISLTFSPRSCSSTTVRYSRMASLIFSITSSSVLPCDQHPGSPGTDTLKPSSDCCSAILYLMLCSPSASGSPARFVLKLALFLAFRTVTSSSLVVRSTLKESSLACHPHRPLGYFSSRRSRLAILTPHIVATAFLKARSAVSLLACHRTAPADRASSARTCRSNVRGGGDVGADRTLSLNDFHRFGAAG